MIPAICCIGHLTIDHVLTPASAVTMPGGTAYYFSQAIARLPVTCRLLTMAAPAQQEVVNSLRAKGIHVRAFAAEQALIFENRYGHNPDERQQRVLQTAAPFKADQVADAAAAILHLGPLLAGDFSAAVIKKLRGQGKISLDVQGFLRAVKDQHVVPTDWPVKNDILPLVDFLKVSEDEMAVLTGTSNIQQGAGRLAAWGAKEIIITRGSKGSVVFSEKQFYAVPAFAPVQVLDATGCGDTYMAGYLFRRSQGATPLDAGRFAAAMATLKLAVSGPFTGTEEEVAWVLKKNGLIIPRP